MSAVDGEISRKGERLEKIWSRSGASEREIQSTVAVGCGLDFALRKRKFIGDEEKKVTHLRLLLLAQKNEEKSRGRRPSHPHRSLFIGHSRWCYCISYSGTSHCTGSASKRVSSWKRMGEKGRGYLDGHY